MGQGCDTKAGVGDAHAEVFAAVTRHVDWGVVRCLVIAGPGFTKDQFKRYLDEEAVRKDVRCRPFCAAAWHMMIRPRGFSPAA